MKCRILVTTIALALIASITALAAPKEGKGKGKGGGGLLPPPIVQSLSAEQKTKYDAIVAEAKDAAGDKEKLMPLRKKAMELLTDDQKAELKKLAPAHKKKQ